MLRHTLFEKTGLYSFQSLHDRPMSYILKKITFNLSVKTYTEGIVQSRFGLPINFSLFIRSRLDEEVIKGA